MISRSLFFLLVSCWSVVSCQAQNQTITVTYSPLQVAVMIDPVTYSKLSLAIPNWWIQRIINKGGIDSHVPINVTTYVSVGAAKAAWAQNITLGMIATRLPDVIIMLCIDTVVPSTANLMEPLGVPVIVPSAPSPSLFRCGSNYITQPPCVKPNTRRYQYAHGISASAENYFEPFISLLKIKKASGIVFLQPVSMSGGASPPTIYQEWTNSIRSLAENNKLACTVIPVRYPAPLTSDLPGIVSQLQAINVDALIALYGCDLYLPYFKSVNYNVKAMSIVRCIDVPSFVTGIDPKELSRYLTSPSQWDPRLTGLEYSEYIDSPISWFPTQDPLNPSSNISSMPSSQQFYQFAQSKDNTLAADYSMAAFAASFEFIEGSVYNWRVSTEQQAINKLNPYNNITNITLTIDRFTLNRQMQLLYQSSMFGLISTNNYGYNQQKQIILIQKMNTDINEIISPLTAAIMDFVYPMPTWIEREYIHSMFATTEEQIICILIGICCVYTLILSMIMCMNRHSKQMRASSFTFSMMMAFGGIVGYLAILTWPIENNNNTCHGRPWLWCLAFQLFFAPLLAKSYRISSIFNMKKLQSGTKHDDKLVTWHTFLIAVPQLIILMIWSLDSPLQLVIRIPDPLRPVFNYADCGSDRAMTYVWLSVAYSALCLLAGCLLAYRVRAAFELFNDARYIANSVYIFTLTSIVIAGVQLGINSSTQMKAIFVIRSIGTLVAYCGSVSLLLLPRAMGVINKSHVPSTYNATRLEENKSLVSPPAPDSECINIKSKQRVSLPSAIPMDERRRSSIQAFQ